MCLFPDLNNNNRTNLNLSSRPASCMDLIFVPTTTHPSFNYFFFFFALRKRQQREYLNGMVFAANQPVVNGVDRDRHRQLFLLPNGVYLYRSKCVRRRGEFRHSWMQTKAHLSVRVKTTAVQHHCCDHKFMGHFSISFDRSVVAAWHLLARCTFFLFQLCRVDASLLGARVLTRAANPSCHCIQLMHARGDKPWIFWCSTNAHSNERRQKIKNKKNKELEI